MNEIEILSHTVVDDNDDDGPAVTASVVVPPSPVPPPRDPTVRVIIFRMYREKLQLILRGIMRDRLVFNPSFIFPFKVCPREFSFYCNCTIY